MEKYIYFGTIIKTHGIQGEVVIECNVGNPQDFTKHIHIENDKQTIPFKVDITGSLNNDRLIIKCEQTNSIEHAKKILNKQLLIPRSTLPPVKNGYYVCDLIGLKALYSNSIQIGVVTDVVDFGSGLNLEVKNLKEKLEYYVYDDDSIVDLQKGVIKIKLLEYV